MSFPLIIRPEAEEDLIESRDWYESQQDDLGQDFLNEIDEVFERISQQPKLYAMEY